MSKNIIRSYIPRKSGVFRAAISKRLGVKDLRFTQYVRTSLNQLFPDQVLYYLDDHIKNILDPHTRDKKKLLQDLSDVPNNVIDAVKNYEAFLVVEIFIESGEGYLDRIYNNLCSLLPSEQIIVLTASRDYKELVVEKAKQFNTKPLKIVIFDYWEKMMKERLRCDYFNVENIKVSNPLERPEFKKIYLNLNYSCRPHRIALISILNNENLLDIGYNSFINVSFPCVNFNVSYNDPKLIFPKLEHFWEEFVETNDFDKTDDMYKSQYVRKHKWARNLLHCHNFFEEPLKSTFINSLKMFDVFPLFLDHPNTAFEGNNFEETRYILPFIRNSVFSLVTETFYSNNKNFEQIGNKHCRFLTEKTFRPIAYKHPFILVTLPNTLQLLRDMGYKTFDGVIDERYDLEKNDTKRLLMIAEEIKRWSKMSIQEIESHRKSMIPIVEHNHNLFLNKQRYIYSISQIDYL